MASCSLSRHPARPLKKNRKVKRKVKPDKTLYEIDIIDIDKAQNKVKIHYKGYGSELDEWRSYVELNLEKQFVYRVMIP